MRGMARFATKPTAPTTERAIAMNDIRCDRTVVVFVWLDLMVSWGVNGILASTQASAVVGVVETEVCDTAAESIGASSCAGSGVGLLCDSPGVMLETMAKTTNADCRRPHCNFEATKLICCWGVG